MKKVISWGAFFFGGLILAGIVDGTADWIADRVRNRGSVKWEGNEVTEEVKQVFFRTEKRHSGCPQNGFLRVCGHPEKIESYGINKAVWPHRCSGCGQTNMIYDARWPQIKAEWRVVK